MILKKKYLILIALASFVLCFDQIVKTYVHTHIDHSGQGSYKKQKVEVIPQFFDIVHIRNYGAAFGIFRDLSPKNRRLFFLLMPPLAMLIIIYIMMGVKSSDKLQIIILSLIFGGATGNYIDRVQYNYVIDFLDFYIKDYHYPAFNVADISIVLGVAGLGFVIFRESIALKNKSKGRTSTPHS